MDTSHRKSAEEEEKGPSFFRHTGAKLHVYVEELGQAGHLKRGQIHAVLQLQPLQIRAGEVQGAQVGAVGEQQLFKP